MSGDIGTDFVIPTRQKADQLFQPSSLILLGAGKTLVLPVIEVDGYQAVSFLLISDQPATVVILESNDPAGPFVQTGSFTTSPDAASGMQAAAFKVNPVGSFMKVLVTNTGAATQKIFQLGVTGYSSAGVTSSSSGGGGAPVNATFVLISANALLPNARVLVAGAGITITDSGPGGTVTISANPVTMPTVFDIGSLRAQFFDDFLSGNTFGVTFGENSWIVDVANGGGVTSGGNGAGALGASNVAGYVTLETHGDAAGEAGIATSEQQFKLTGGVVTWQARIFIPILSTLAEEYSLYVGVARFLGTGSIGVSFIYNRLVSPNWIMVTDSGGGGTQTPTAVPVVAGAWITLKAVVNADGTSVEYFVNGVSVGTIVTNIPSATDYLTPNMSIIKSNGGTSRMFFVDYFGLTIVFTTPR